MIFKRAVSLAVAVSIVTNTLSWAYYVTLLNIVMAPKVYAANEIYEQLENNFDLANPAANRTSTVTTEDILEKYKNKIINIHPALLPRFGGKGMYGDRVHEAVVAAGEKESGITIHYINEHYDEGNAIFQATCPVLPTDSPDDVAKKVHALEYEHFPQVIEQVLRNKY